MNVGNDSNQNQERTEHCGEDRLLELDREGMEVDSDVNEDSNREHLLDASFKAWYQNIDYWVKQKDQITQVPGESVFDAAVDIDAEEDRVNDE
ncbi:hypothetical protein [Paenibacillus sp. J2TS4]|uniref:hypothetical protein n=1 Tax=Paenibacillus sp. J2TS4 TaxID=2807194 RepID=UPI001B0735F4|nr:hypothetical protein [Paenibacillus sp. J2TS4]GIP35174.1 hypothetical protein J2TS4_43840 [Paenibacillus sp. J2TS4]